MFPIQESVVSVPRAEGNGDMESFFARPKATGSVPGLVVIHEAFGLNDNIREITRQFAEQGYAALAVDLFSNRNRMLCMLQIFHGMLIRPLHNSILSDLQAAMASLRREAGVDQDRTGAVGFCMGGAYALQLAVTEKDMKVASVFYGANPKPLEALAQSCPIVGSYPDKDFTTQAARELETVLVKSNVPHDIKIYPDTKHSFFSRQRTDVEAKASKDAWQRMLSFFHEHLN